MLCCVYAIYRAKNNAGYGQRQVRSLQERRALCGQGRRQCVGLALVVLAMVISTLAITPPGAYAASLAACDYYASPDGTGNGLSPSRPFKIRAFWAVAAPGKTLCLLDGTYTGSDSVIRPPNQRSGHPTTLSGKQGQPITIRALNDGKATINGQFRHRTVELFGNSWFVLEGFNVHSSSQTVVNLGYGANHNIVRRVIAWDAADPYHYNPPQWRDTAVFHSQFSEYNLFEDVAGWGMARKVYTTQQGGNHTTFRRTWGRWEGSHTVGPKYTFSFSYNATHNLLENAIGTWDGIKMRASYVLQCPPTQRTGRCAGQTRNTIDQPESIFGETLIHGSHVRLLGTIAYQMKDQKKYCKRCTGLYWMPNTNNVEIDNSAAYSAFNQEPFDLWNNSRGSSEKLFLTNATGISQRRSAIASKWQISNFTEGSDHASVPNIFTALGGAQICNRYKDGKLTNEPLWPWPMDQRIYDALQQSGKEPFYITDKIEEMFGPIPNSCRKDTQVSEQPPAPRNLRVVQ